MPERDRPGVLVTRPAGQADTLCELLRQAGFKPRLLPAIAIEATDPAPAQAALRAALPCDVAVFISVNAVQHALPVIAAVGGLPPSCQLAAVGPATAAALSAAGFTNVLVPARRHDSQGLLALAALRAVAGQRVVIFRGEGGRRLLADALGARGADVRAVTSYRRSLPHSGAAQLAAWLADEAIALVTATSRAGLEGLLTLAGPAAEQVKGLPLAVLSAALTERSRALGYIGPVAVASEASDAGLVAAVLQLCDPSQPAG